MSLRYRLRSIGAFPTMDIALAFDLKSDFQPAGGPDDRLEEYDSRATVEAIQATLTELGHRVRLFGGGRLFLEQMLAAPPELVFNFAEGGGGTRSREAHVPAVCEMLGIAVTHSDPLTLAVTLDKAMAKRLVAAAGVATPRFEIVENAHDAAGVALPYPLIAKPLFEGSSMGIRRHSRVTDAAGLRREVERLLADYDEPVLVEEFCSGPEYTIGILGTGASARVVGTMEIAPKLAKPEEFVYSLEVKRDWEREVEYHVPPRQSLDHVRAAETLALAAYKALGCRDVSRVDVRLTAAGEARFIEINPLPGLNPETGDLVILARRRGLAYEGLIAAIVASACERSGI